MGPCQVEAQKRLAARVGLLASSSPFLRLPPPPYPQPLLPPLLPFVQRVKLSGVTSREGDESVHTAHSRCKTLPYLEVGRGTH